MRSRSGWTLQRIAVLVDVAGDDVIGRRTLRQSGLRLDDGSMAVLNEVEGCHRSGYSTSRGPPCAPG
jgi:hypothetical protein